MPDIWWSASSVVIIIVNISVLTISWYIWLISSVSTCLPRMSTPSPRLQYAFMHIWFPNQYFQHQPLSWNPEEQAYFPWAHLKTCPQLYSWSSFQPPPCLRLPSQSMASHPVSWGRNLSVKIPGSFLTHTHPLFIRVLALLLQNKPKHQWFNLNGRLYFSHVKCLNISSPQQLWRFQDIWGQALSLWLLCISSVLPLFHEAWVAYYWAHFSCSGMVLAYNATGTALNPHTT